MQTAVPKPNKKRLHWLPQRTPMQRRGSRALGSPRTFKALQEWLSVNKQEIKMPALGNQNQKNQWHLEMLKQRAMMAESSR